MYQHEQILRCDNLRAFVLLSKHKGGEEEEGDNNKNNKMFIPITTYATAVDNRPTEKPEREKQKNEMKAKQEIKTSSDDGKCLGCALNNYDLSIGCPGANIPKSWPEQMICNCVDHEHTPRIVNIVEQDCWTNFYSHSDSDQNDEVSGGAKQVQLNGEGILMKIVVNVKRSGKEKVKKWVIIIAAITQIKFTHLY